MRFPFKQIFTVVALFAPFWLMGAQLPSSVLVTALYNLFRFLSKPVQALSVK